MKGIQLIKLVVKLVIKLAKWVKYFLLKSDIRRCFPALGLVEMAWVLLIIGLLIGGAMKGIQLLEQAKIQRLSQEIVMYRQALEVHFKSYPWSNFAKDYKAVWQMMSDHCMIKSLGGKEYPETALDGQVSLYYDENMGRLCMNISALGKDMKKGFLTSKQANALKNFLIEWDEMYLLDEKDKEYKDIHAQAHKKVLFRVVVPL